MTDSRRYALTPQRGIDQILLDAQHRWLRPAEICEILRNYHKFQLTMEAPTQPTSGSLFLFNRKVLRYFRKDGHNWRKKKDGKTVKEAHERLKSGSIDVLHCYYAHGEENEYFQRRTYWMLEEDFMHIVFVHYRDVKDSKTSWTKDLEKIPQSIYHSSPDGSDSLGSQNYVVSQSTDAESHGSAQMSGYEDSGTDNYQTSSRYNAYLEMPGFDGKSMMDTSHLGNWIPVSQSIQGNHQQQAISSASELYQGDATKIFNEKGLDCTLDSASWGDVLEHCTTGLQSYFPPQVSSSLPVGIDCVTQRQTAMFGEVSMSKHCINQADTITTTIQGQGIWQGVDSEADTNVLYNVDERDAAVKEGNADYHALLKQLSLELTSAEGDEVFKKQDSLSKWMSKELGEMDDSHIKSNSGIDWDVVENENAVMDSGLSQQDHLYPYALSPSLSQEQLYSIIDFSPNWTYSGLETKVLITGKFLKNKNEVEHCKWSCMFGEVEVPAEILADSILRCYAPPHKPGRVPFYVTCSNRLACSEIREFEYLLNHARDLECAELYGKSKSEILLHVRLEKLLSLGPINSLGSMPRTTGDKSLIRDRISSLLLETDDEWSHMLIETTDREFSASTAKDELLQKLLKEKLHSWLLYKVVEDGKGASILDKEGQGVIHLAAALAYDWAIAPTMIAGVSINFRDFYGWSALHWAAYYGRERTVVALVSLGADPGALSDPTPEFPSGRTPADLASSSRHKGIAGFLAKHSLTAHLSALTIRDSGLREITGISHTKTIENTKDECGIQFDGGVTQEGSSLQDSLCAVRVATQAAARIHQVFRVHSFHRKKLVEYGDINCGMSDEQVLSLVAVKANKAGQHDEPVQVAAMRIQNKFRGWKGRKEFMVIRQHIVKIQAHVRGHQVRKHFRKVVWSVGIVEKAILRWRRKGSGLRGFRSGVLIERPNMRSRPTEEEDYDYLEEGRKQTEERLEKALARVKSMVQYPEARDQYQRLLAGVKEYKESKVLERILNDPEEVAIDGSMMFDIEELLGEDTPMPPA